MNGRKQQLLDLAIALKNELSNPYQSGCIIFPPSLFIEAIAEALSGSAIAIGAQNVYPEDAGAYTGEISTAMLEDTACRYVLVGHSERRHLFKEDEKFIAKKFHHVKYHDMIPVLCVGETLEQRQSGRMKESIAEQISAVYENKESFKGCIIAYEPVWAIGTGINADPEQAQEVHAYIRAMLNELTEGQADNVSILYGGSLNEKNASALFAMPDIDGGLVGGASLDSAKFVEIVKCIN